MLNELGQWIFETSMMFSTWLGALFTAEHLGYLGLGWSLAWVWHWGKATVKHRKIVLRWRPAIYVLAMLLVAWIMVSTSQANRCIQEFNQTLRYRSQIGAENDALSMQQRQILAGWMHQLVFPPPHIAPLENGDPRRQQWAVQVTLDADNALSETFAAQQENERRRAENPLPNPTCN